MVSRLFALLALVLCCTFSHAEEPAKQIPLEQIWALKMPGTREVSKLEGNTPLEDSLVTGIRQELSSRTGKQDAGPAFAVKGDGLEALRAANGVLTTGKKPNAVLPVNMDISVVFFTLNSGHFVHLTGVERQGHSINISYEFVPHETHILTQHLALIPLGKLPKGTFKVNISGRPLAKEFVSKGFRELPDAVKQSRVCTSFEFEVK